MRHLKFQMIYYMNGEVFIKEMMDQEIHGYQKVKN